MPFSFFLACRFFQVYIIHLKRVSKWSDNVELSKYLVGAIDKELFNIDKARKIAAAPIVIIPTPITNVDLLTDSLQLKQWSQYFRDNESSLVSFVDILLVLKNEDSKASRL